MPRTDWGWLVTPDELAAWILEESDELLVVDKPAHVLCHPSKHGPWSSLVGACREYLGVERLHLTFRLDRETSGVVVLAKKDQTASWLQKAIERREVRKTYLAILAGLLDGNVQVKSPIGPDPHSRFVARQWIIPEGRQAETEFAPLQVTQKYTLVKAHPFTGRRHQIRVHAASIGHAVVGDKLYGPDPELMLRFIAEGFTEQLARELLLDRHALHAYEVEFPSVFPGTIFRAPWPPDLARFWAEQTNPIEIMPLEGG
jgi:23S rRNA pseudouridine1911/1915/1917 synthase